LSDAAVRKGLELKEIPFAGFVEMTVWLVLVVNGAVVGSFASVV
jgi:hypothetical protein